MARQFDQVTKQKTAKDTQAARAQIFKDSRHTLSHLYNHRLPTAGHMLTSEWGHFAEEIERTLHIHGYERLQIASK